MYFKHNVYFVYERLSEIKTLLLLYSFEVNFQKNMGSMSNLAL